MIISANCAATDPFIMITPQTATNGTFWGVFHDYQGKIHYCWHKHQTADEAVECAEGMLAEFWKKNRTWRKRFNEGRRFE